MTTVIRDVTPADLEAVYVLNQAARPAVSDVTLDDIERYVTLAEYFRVADRAGQIEGFLIGLTQKAEYNSMNFQWFRRHHDSFVYIDRIVIRDGARGSGLGRRFYADFEDFGRPLASIMTCEVNTRPRNDESLAFHNTLGFSAVGTRETENGTKTVAMLSKSISVR